MIILSNSGSTQIMTISEQLAIIFGVIGAVTGIIALLLQVSSERRNYVNLIFNLDSYKQSYYVNEKIPGYESNCYAIINLKISNPSALPITIDTAKIETSTKTIFHHYDDNVDSSPKILNVDTNIWSYTKNNPPMNTPFRLDGYDSQYVCLFFPFFEGVSDNSFEVIFETPKKNFKIRLQLREYNDILLASVQK